MTELACVALWTGLIGSVVSIVLSVVAIVFAVLVNHRSDQVSDQTVKSLQKIESTIERMSSDTNGLIKAAWEKLLGNVGFREEGHLSRSMAKEIASGLASELKSELEHVQSENNASGGEQTRTAELEKAVARIEKSLEVALRGRAVMPSSLGMRVARLKRFLEKMSPIARALAATIVRRHLTREQYTALVESSPLKSAIRELRLRSLLVPMATSKGALVYWLAPGVADALGSALQLLPAVSSDALKTVASELRKVGYESATGA